MTPFHLASKHIAFPVEPVVISLDFGNGFDYGQVKLTGTLALLRPQLSARWLAAYHLALTWHFVVPCSDSGEGRWIKKEHAVQLQELQDPDLIYVRYVRQPLSYVLQHEVDEGLFINGTRFTEPHPERKS